MLIYGLSQETVQYSYFQLISVSKLCNRKMRLKLRNVKYFTVLRTFQDLLSKMGIGRLQDLWMEQGSIHITGVFDGTWERHTTTSKYFALYNFKFK